MKRQILYAMLAVFLLLSVIPTSVSAHEEQESKNIIVLEDGIYIEISIEETFTKAINSKSGSKTYTCKTSSGEVLWKARLSAVFTYNGSSATCTSGDCTVTISDNAWYVISNSTSRSSNTATTNLKMGEKLLGITINKQDYTITLSCDKNGNLS